MSERKSALLNWAQAISPRNLPIYRSTPKRFVGWYASGLCRTRTGTRRKLNCTVLSVILPWRLIMTLVSKVKLAGAVALLSVLVTPAANGQGRWVRLGSAHVDGNQDHDKITVGARDGR